MNDEFGATRAMIDRTEVRFLKPKRLIADTAYGSGRFLGWLVNEQRVTPHIPVWNKTVATIAPYCATTSPSTRSRTSAFPRRQGAHDDGTTDENTRDAPRRKRKTKAFLESRELRKRVEMR